MHILFEFRGNHLFQKYDGQWVTILHMCISKVAGSKDQTIIYIYNAYDIEINKHINIIYFRYKGDVWVYQG